MAGIQDTNGASGGEEQDTNVNDNDTGDRTEAVRLFAAVSGFAAVLAPDLDLAPESDSESVLAHNARLLEAMRPKCDNLRDQIDELAETILELDLRGTEDAGACGVAAKRLRELVDERAVLTAERDTLKRSLTAQKGVATRAKAEASAAIEAAAPKKLRHFAPLKTPLAAAELEQLLADDADDIEVAFFDEDGEEIDGLPPFALTGAKRFRRGMSGLGLTAPELRVHGPATGQPAFKLAGYALIADGDVVAVKRRSDVLPIGPGSTMELKDDVVF